MLSKDDIELALRHEKDLADCKAQSLAIKELEEDKKARDLAHQELLKQEHKRLRELHQVAKRSGAAARALKLAVPQEQRDAIDAAERDERALSYDLKVARREVRVLAERVERLKLKDADKATLQEAREDLAEAEQVLAPLEERAKVLAARVEKTRKVAADAIADAIKAAQEKAAAEKKGAKKPDGGAA